MATNKHTDNYLSSTMLDAHHRSVMGGTAKKEAVRPAEIFGSAAGADFHVHLQKNGATVVVDHPWVTTRELIHRHDPETDEQLPSQQLLDHPNGFDIHYAPGAGSPERAVMLDEPIELCSSPDQCIHWNIRGSIDIMEGIIVLVEGQEYDPESFSLYPTVSLQIPRMSSGRDVRQAAAAAVGVPEASIVELYQVDTELRPTYKHEAAFNANWPVDVAMGVAPNVGFVSVSAVWAVKVASLAADSCQTITNLTKLYGASVAAEAIHAVVGTLALLPLTKEK